jgi:hypothetical protein
MNKSLLWMTGLAAAMSFNSCDHADHPDHNHENELFTTIRLHLKQENTGTESHIEWRDITPFDQNGRTIDTIMLDTSVSYTGRIELLDESKSPAKDVTKEIEKEKDEHLFVYKPAVNKFFSVIRLDKDSKNREVGLQFKIDVKNLPGDTVLNVVLRHQPGVKDGSEGPGDSDLDVWFPVKIR